MNSRQRNILQALQCQVCYRTATPAQTFRLLIRMTQIYRLTQLRRHRHPFRQMRRLLQVLSHLTPDYRCLQFADTGKPNPR